jgi:3-oxoacyl-[acyl-carrier protein] reductase
MSAQVAVVLGGTKGLGRGCAEALAQAGFAVAVTARTATDLDEATVALRRRGVAAMGWCADVTDPEAMAAMFTDVESVLGPVGVLVANAGGPPPGSVLDLTDDAWRAGFELTFLSTVRAIGLAVPQMRRAGYGRILILGSSSVSSPLPNLAISNAMRPALLGVMKSLAIDLGPEQITVNLVSPGRIATERVAQLDAATAQRQHRSVEEVRAASEATIPMGRYGQPADLGALVAFLAGPDAGYVTGQSILVDGGLVRSLR